MASERVRWVGLYFCMLLFSSSKAFHRPSASLNLQPHLSRSPTNSRLSNGVMLSALKLPEKKKEMSDLDRDILKELLEDQNFLQTLSNQNQTVSNSLREEIMKKPKKSKSSFPGINSDENADFQSETFKKAEEFQQVLGSLWGGFAAAFESAAIFVANKVAEDIKVTLFMGQRVLFDTRRTLAAGKDAPPGPARLLAAAARGAQARNLTAAEATQLLRSGALRLEDLGSQDRRLGSVRGSKVARARNKKVQKKGAPLPLRAAAALPELTGRAADLAYEVNREIKYEEAGRKVEKYANLLGVDASFLLGPEAAAKARGLRPVAQDGGEGGVVGTAAAAAGFLEAEAPAPKLVTTYGQLLELLNGVKPELAAYEEINKLGAPPSASPGGGLGLRVAGGGGGGGGEGLDIDVEGEAAPTEEAAARRAALKTLDVLILLLERLLTAGVPALTEVVEVAGSRAAAALGGPTGRGGGWEPLGGLRTRRRPSPPPSSSSQQQGG